MSNSCDIKSDFRVFKFVIFHIDSYVTKPNFNYDITYSNYKKTKVNLVTVVRVFGCTDDGIKVCMHIHQYFPHLSVRQKDILDAYNSHKGKKNCEADNDLINYDVMNIFIMDLESELKKRQNKGISNDCNQFIYMVEPYSSCPIYGYYDQPEIFYKIYFYHTSTLETARYILENGLINNHSILPYNLLEFILQFYIDNQIYLNQLYLKKVTFRQNEFFKNFENIFAKDSIFYNIGKEKLNFLSKQLCFNKLQPTSSCFLECDAIVSDIVHMSHEKHFPAKTPFIPSLPGIINLWNDQYSRINNEAEFESFVQILSNNSSERILNNDIEKQNLQTKILKNFIHNKQNQMIFSPIKSVNNIQDIEDFDDIEDVDDLEMSFTQQQLNLCPNERDNLYVYENSFSDDDLDNKLTIPQFDGMDDDPVESKINAEPISCMFKRKKIKLQLDHFEPGFIKLPKLSFDHILKSKRILVSEHIRMKITNKYNQICDSKSLKTENLLDNCESIVTGHLISSSSTINIPSDSRENENLIYSYYSGFINDDLNNTSSCVPSASNSKVCDISYGEKCLPFSPLSISQQKPILYLHSTPNMEPSCSKELHKKQQKETCRLNLFEKNASMEQINLPKSNFDFLLSQNSKTQINVNYTELSSMISTASSKQMSFDCLTIDSAAKSKWCKSLQITTMCLELHMKTRNDLLPNPNYDEIQIAMFSIYDELLKDDNTVETDGTPVLNFCYIGAIIVNPNSRVKKEKIVFSANKTLYIDYVSSELELFLKVSFYVKNFDPDIICGYTIDTLSWGYLFQRAIALDLDILTSMSRITNNFQSKRNCPGSYNNCPQLVGRISMNVWTLLRNEVTLRSYTFENVYYHVLQERVPKYTYQYLGSLWNKGLRTIFEIGQRTVLEYYFTRTIGVIKILAQLNLIRRTFDLSSLFGMKFEDVLNRGSQFRVESMLFPLCKLENFVPIRFSNNYVLRQDSPQCIPLVLEPNGSFHREPVAVLDFQSLYPSVMIANNYCFSTCLGKVKNIVRSNELFGCYKLKISKDLLIKLKDDIHISPNGVAFVKPHIRRGVLPKMLEDLLYTRILVKRELKEVSKKLSNQNSSCLQRQLKNIQRKLDICQLGLKLISNVTYGYTSANFSGRMPCVDVADSIVSKGREALEQTILFINKWGVESGTNAKVIYGDTDSVFISFPNASLKEAFDWADIIAKEITKRNPYPMGIKLEKIYQPCLLLAKKRYCGYAFESDKQSNPKFDAKGIETVRRDSCPATSKILEKCIKIVFDSNGDISQLKSYMQWQIKKILNGQISNLNDFIFAKEYFGLNNYCNDSVIPSCIVARNRIRKDPMNEPKMHERVPYVIIDGPIKSRLADLVREPFEILEDSSLRLNSSYYIQRVIFPPLVRVVEVIIRNGLNLLMAWYNEVRHFQTNKLKTVSHHPPDGIGKLFRASTCVVCKTKILDKRHTKQTNIEYPLCPVCIQSKQAPAVIVNDNLWTVSQKLHSAIRLCSLCCGANIRTLAEQAGGGVEQRSHQCVARECPHLFRYHQARLDFNKIATLEKDIRAQLTTHDCLRSARP